MHRLFRPTLFALALLLMLPSAAAMANALEQRLAQTRAEASEARKELATVDRRQQAVVRQVTQLNRRIAALEVPLRRLEREVEALEYQIERRGIRIVELRAERARQLQDIVRLDREHEAAQRLLETRVVTAYKTGDTGLIEQLAAAGSVDELFRREEALSRIVGLDERVISRITDAERQVRIKRARNFEIRREIQEAIDTLAAERARVDGKRADVQRQRDQVAAAKAQRDRVLEKLQKREQDLGAHLDNLEEDARVLREVIRTGTVTYNGQVSGLSSSGLIWPVHGPVVSPYGPRWGRMHQGIDIAISAGNPIYASASGIVTHAGWMGGYGNMVVIQHAGSLATGYAHQSQIAVASGQLVQQGQLIGFIGCTGHCYGDHLHYEVYVNGSPQNPLAYLT
jgi:murein DD-endopeptidase MepM/ murein hydrolase activator NlpD